MDVGHDGDVFVDERQPGNVAKLLFRLFLNLLGPCFDRLAGRRRDDSQNPS